MDRDGQQYLPAVARRDEPRHPVEGGAEVVAPALVRGPSVKAIRTRMGPTPPHSCASNARWAASAASSAPEAEGKAAQKASPTVLKT